MSPDAAPLAALQAWVNQHPSYAYTTEAVERTAGGREVPATLHVTFDGVTKTQTVHVVRGNGAGSDIRWSGGTTAVVRAPGVLHLLQMRMNVRDRRILSPRGNDVRTADFARVVKCFAAAAHHVHVESSSPQATVLALVDDRGVRCGAEYGDEGVTEDRITFEPADGRPIMRERLAGGSVVERWRIEDLQTRA